MIYFDAAATTLQKPPAVALASVRAIRSLASPGRGGYEPAMAAAERVFACREAAAALFNVPAPEQVVLTMNATHGLNIAIKSLARKGSPVVVTGYEHNAVLRPLNAVGARVEVAAAPLFAPEAALAAFEEKLRTGAELAVVNAVSNVFGFIQPLERMAALCRAYGVPLIVDASQAAGSLALDFSALGAAFMAMPGHKGLYGPQGTGLLLCAQPGRTLMEGGSGSDSTLPLMPDYLPERHEAGTVNVPGAAGLLEGLRFVARLGPERIGQKERQLLRLARRLLGELEELTLYDAPEGVEQAPVLSFTARGADPQTLAGELARRGFALRAGLHCAPLAHKTGGTLPEGTVRLSLSVFNTEAELFRLARSLKTILHESF